MSGAQGLRDDLLRELHGLTSLDFDGREYLTVWLVGHPLLARRLRLQQHAALAYAPLVAARRATSRGPSSATSSSAPPTSPPTSSSA